MALPDPPDPCATLSVDVLSTRLRSAGRLLRIWPRASCAWREVARGTASALGEGAAVRLTVDGDAGNAADRLLPLRAALAESGIRVDGLFVRPNSPLAEREVLVTAVLDGVVAWGPGSFRSETVLEAPEASQLQLEASRSLAGLLAERHGIDLDSAGLRPEELLRWQFGVLVDEGTEHPMVDGSTLMLSPREISDRLARSLSPYLGRLVSEIAERASAADRVRVSASLEGELALSASLRSALPPEVEVTVESEAERSGVLERVADERWDGVPLPEASEGGSASRRRSSTIAVAFVIVMAACAAYATVAWLDASRGRTSAVEDRTKIEGELAKARQDLEKAKGAAAEATTNVEKANSMIRSLESQRDQQKATIQELQSQVKAKDGTIAEKAGQIERLNTEQNVLRADRDAKLVELRSMNDEQGVLRRQLAAVNESSRTRMGWAVVLEVPPDPAVVTNASLRDAITATGLPWRVRDIASGIEMVLVPPGSFEMGCSPSNRSACEADEFPTRLVSLPRAFYLGRYEVTQDRWVAVMGSNPSSFTDGQPSTSTPPGSHRPVESVSWNQVAIFNASTGLRLPTEAEWEYAYRAGSSSKAFHPFSGQPDGTNDESKLDDIAWFSANSAERPQPVGRKKANGFGLHDMSGNVGEWVNDRYAASHGAGALVTDPTGPPSGTDRVVKGGSFVGGATFCRSSNRTDTAASNVHNSVGFRVARNP